MPADTPCPRRLLVVGTGLVGASAGLALQRAGCEVLLADRDPAAVTLAAARGAGRPWAGEHVDHALVAVPPSAVPEVLADLQARDAADSYSDAASVKAAVLAGARARGVDLTVWCPAHPIAGRERGGAGAALADLFTERAWVLCPAPETGPAAVAATRALATLCGAVPVVLAPERHDEVLAVLSHVPQLVASALATSADRLETTELGLAGGGFRDGTRVAVSDPRLWGEIVGGNADAVRRVLDRVLAELGSVRAALDDGPAGPAVERLVTRGAAVRRGLPDKPGRQRAWTPVAVLVDDRPGALARVFDIAGEQRVNIEDVRLDHSPEHDRGLAELAVAAEAADRLVAAFATAGLTAWPVRAAS